MARQRNPNRDEAKTKWLNSFGKLPTKQLADEAGVSESRVRKWKSEDKWKEALAKKERKKGGQPGNSNALGAGAPYGNSNAETHGAYCTVHLDSLTEDRRQYIASITLNTEENMLRELQLLTAKEADLRDKIHTLDTAAATTLYTDRVVQMLVPCKQEDTEPQGEPQDGGERLKVSMQTVLKASPFERKMKLESELNKVHGRIIKLLDSIKGYEIDNRRIDLEERKYILAKQKITGEYNINSDGEIDDSYSDEVDALIK